MRNDFGVFGSTPLTFPIEWPQLQDSRHCRRVSVPNFHGFSALFVFSSVAARFFNPQLGGAGAVPPGEWWKRYHPVPHRSRRKVQPDDSHTIPPWKNGRGSASIGDTTVAWWAGAVPVSDGGRVDLTLPAGSLPTRSFQAGLFCGSAHRDPTNSSLDRVLQQFVRWRHSRLELLVGSEARWQ